DAIAEDVSRKLNSVIGNSSLIALALTGSRAAEYSNHSSDYDFFAIYDLDLAFSYHDFFIENKKISVKIEGKQKFEENIKSHLNQFTEQGSLVWLPYKPFMGADYLGIIESEARSILTDHFISNLPYNKLVKVSPERIAEWSFIKEALIWPSSINRLKRIAELECKPLEKVIPKYVQTLNQKGFHLADGQYILKNSCSKKTDENSFIKKLLQDAARYRNKNIPNLRDYFDGLSFMLLQIPELVSNLFYTFPKFEERETYLDYVGPTLIEFCNSRAYLEPFRRKIKDLKEKLLE
ncbi:MAG: hypothetical protein AABX45_00295, partial [Nanoarchaeota archaeon]